MASSQTKRTAGSCDPVAPALHHLYDRHAQELSVLMGWFFLRHLNHLYRTFNGDLLMAIVLGEIAHHNICHHYSSGKPRHGMRAAHGVAPEVLAHLEPCNAFSLSAATGIPRETCRRKVQALVKQGLVVRQPKGGCAIARHIGPHFRDTNRQTFATVMEFIRDVQTILNRPIQVSRK